ncbi:mechanosensitive ion channel domain-containing protein [Psychromonas antarctica]|uniref:mechanosensitive ion channel domain-containing protein n=1 Tax=Psychromonas antarctica TaxID=67573 RepID=UPI001EE98BA9|nr:mechanosensitive ion channel domain-containing protein [Psychromonas antarctica]MCG6200844.1 mechanosensitive ion channel [Psychromonas antarctica]
MYIDSFFKPLRWTALSLLLLLVMITKGYAALPTVKMVDEQIVQLGVDPTVNAAALELLQHVQLNLEEIQSLQQKNETLLPLLEQAPQRKVALQKTLDDVTAAQPNPIAASASSNTLEQNLAVEKARNKEWTDQLTQLLADQQILLVNQETLPNEIAEQEQILYSYSNNDRMTADNSAGLGESRPEQWLSESKQVLAETKLKWLNLQQDTLVQRRELAKTHVKILEQQLILSNKQIDLLHARLLEEIAQSSLKVIEQSKQLSRALADAPAVIQEWNSKNEKLAVESETVSRQLLLSQQTRQQLEADRQRTNQNLAEIKGNLKWLKHSPAFSDTIRFQLSQLPSLTDKKDLTQTISAAHLQRFQFNNELSTLKNIPLLVATLAETAGLNNAQQIALSRVLSFRVEVLTSSLDKTDQFITEITRLDALREQFSAELTAERDFLSETQLFIRGRAALWQLFSLDINNWFGSVDIAQRVQQLLTTLLQYKGEFALLVGLFILVLLAGWQVRKAETSHRVRYAKTMGKVRKDAFSHTLLLLLFAVSYGALLSLWMLAAESWIELRLTPFYTRDLNSLFIAFATVVFAWEAFSRMATSDGLLERHFSWSSETVKWIKLILSQHRWILYSLLVCMLFAEILSEQAESMLLRLVFVFLALWLVIFFVTIFKSQRLTTQLPLFLQSQAALQLLRILIILPIIAIAGLAIWGYFYASWVALFYHQAVLLCFVSALLLQQLGVRWLKIEQRKLALQRALDRREEQLKRDKNSESGSDEVDETVLAVEAISEQSLTLLNIAVLAYLLVMLSTVFSDGLVALQWMNDVTIWEVVSSSDTGNVVENVSLKAALSAVLILGVSLFSAQNIAGFLELLVWQRLNISTGASYAATALLRYCLVLGGVIVSFSTLGFHWSELQWLVAALGFGLGFGLQEIFANLVSGIILLFERPIRVGDTITIGDLSGTVMRINTRATTILDWDKKEIIVPNKALITEQLVNWSLSDQVTRVIIPIGVAYGSDVALVKRLLMQSASECPEINKDPESVVRFMAFGGSSLDFELRIYLSKIDHRVEVQDKLNTRIDQLFREHKIEIAFPQMDIHIRDLPLAVPAL